MSTLVWEFDSVKDKDGNDKMTKELHANPVNIGVLIVGRCALLPYADWEGRNLTTTTVESISIIHEHIKIVTKNTLYTLKPYIRNGVY